ncbi:hypothetical protein [Cronobacter phage vB_Cdu_VP8]|nr:hypothetical protein [Cronobacter phage vB_Cdu_VP8]
MQIDYDYVNGLRELERKEAKDLLAEYAKEYFNLELKRSKSFDTLVKEIDEFVASHSDEDIPYGEGFSTADLIDAVDHLEGKDQFDEADERVVAQVKGIIEEKAPAEIVLSSPISPIGDVHTTVDVQESGLQVASTEIPAKFDTLIEAAKAIKADEEGSDLYVYDLKGFVPHLYMFGRHPGYAHLPFWIYDWIKANPDWKANPEKCPHWEAHQTLKSLLYYIRRDGQVRIRESRNSRFDVLK